jgi:hypothetical protein
MTFSTPTRFEHIVVLVALGTIGIIAPTACVAQARPIVVQLNAQEVLTLFRERARTGVTGVPDIVEHPENYPRGRRDSVIAGFEKLAVADSDEESVREKATMVLAVAASDKEEYPGLFERVTRLYATSNSRAVRWFVIHYIAKGKDPTRGIEFLKSILTSPAPRDFDVAPYLAALELSFMGAEGRAILNDLNGSGLIIDSQARGYTQWFLANR